MFYTTILLNSAFNMIELVDNLTNEKIDDLKRPNGDE